MSQDNVSFRDLNIAPLLLDTLERMHFKTPTPIQHKAIPYGIKGEDVMGIAQTGTGKTVAFGIPMIQRLSGTDGLGLVLVPTRELAVQVDETIRRVGHTSRITTAVLIGGEPVEDQVYALRAKPRVLIVTPGRLLDHLSQRNVRLDKTEVLVLDEADRMLDMGFQPQIESILRSVPKQRQTMLFSATMPPEIVKMAHAYMKEPVRVEVAPSGTAAERVSQEIFIVKRDAKNRLLGKILRQYRGTVLLFSRTKIGARKITRAIRNMGHEVGEIHSDRSLEARREALDGFKSGRYRILVATDIAARGIDVTGIELVLNYDLPNDAEGYVHRIGRTGRAGEEGHAISFATPDQERDVKNIERLIRMPIPLATHPELEHERFSADAESRPRFDRHARPGRGRGTPRQRGRSSFRSHGRQRHKKH